MTRSANQLCGLTALAALGLLSACLLPPNRAEPGKAPAENPVAPAAQTFPTPLSPDLPYDVDVAALGRLNRDTQVPEAQRLFDIFAWQAFLALNWPADENGAPDRSKTLRDSTSRRVWMSWRRNDTIFLPTGEKPAPWNAKASLKQKRYLWRFSKMLNERRSPQNSLTDSVQAFTGPLVDQNGVFVRYESYLNKPQFDYIVENELYNQEGQVRFVAEKGNLIRFPANQTKPVKRHGSMGIKLAWKQLGPDDLPERFFTMAAIVVSTSFDSDGKPVLKESNQLVGLVGMHVTALTQSSPNWIWTTFEHVDNVVANDLQFGKTRTGERRRVRPNFNNPDAPTKLVNQLPLRNALPDDKNVFTTWDESKTTNPVQLARLIPIPPATQQLNHDVQQLLRQQGSVFQFYELVGAQWPVQPGFPAFGGGAGSAAESILFKAPGRVVPVYLVNSTMESYFADNPNEPVTPDRTRVFGTESCVGCHFSAGAAIAFKRDENRKLLVDAKTGLKTPIYGKNGSFGQTGNAHYFWQFQLKARQKTMKK
jgi:hypothetical protein